MQANIGSLQQIDNGDLGQFNTVFMFTKCGKWK